MISLDSAHRAVHYPGDRRFRVWISRSTLIVLIALVVVPFALAWVQGAVFGLPSIAPSPASHEGAVSGPHGFPTWIRWSHFFNFFFLFMLIRSGLSILMDHPRLYFNDHCTPGTEWIRFTPLKVPKDRIWTAKDDARYISPIVALPGYRHTVGVARSWHFINVYGFVLTGVFFVGGLLTSDQWLRLIPTSPTVFVQAWNTFVHYANFRFPPEPNGFYGYNALQQLAYFATVFLMAPLSILAGMAMSPALVNRFPAYARLFGGRQSARSIHFLLLVGFIGFIVAHVTLVVLTGFARNMNHIVLGTDDMRSMGMILGFVGIAILVLSWVAAHYVSWFFPRALQHAQKAISLPLKLITLDRLIPSEHYTKDQISPHFWPNGKMPQREDWKQLEAGDFKDYKLKVSGLIENPVELSIADMRKLGSEDSITMHHCIQGWSGIAQWGGLSMSKLIEHVKPKPYAKVVAFYSFGEGLYGGAYYDTQDIYNARKPECLLAFEMNGQPLPAIYGAPLRLRVENQLGYKMVKWIERIEFIESEKPLGKGEGGKNEDDEYFDLLPNI
ncbi:MAG: molybdopterin-dependent oxidoreductase [Candidatus Eremiobacteraeota bacterium]|nr:molybdopterin-dependent oxidoreductase [Candidatus Eremiobacteraeota bacterium]MBC5827313.1 molybdopterin-dependent oxidoreductase [Candidatus Eremiobacteraeota bacterium]